MNKIIAFFVISVIGFIGIFALGAYYKDINQPHDVTITLYHTAEYDFGRNGMWYEFFGYDDDLVEWSVTSQDRITFENLHKGSIITIFDATLANRIEDVKGEWIGDAWIPLFIFYIVFVVLISGLWAVPIWIEEQDKKYG